MLGGGLYGEVGLLAGGRLAAGGDLVAWVSWSQELYGEEGALEVCIPCSN